MKDTMLKAIVGLVITAAVALAGLFLHFQVKSQVETQLAAAGYPSSATIDLIKKDIEANRERFGTLKEQSDNQSDKIERIVDILLEP